MGLNNWSVASKVRKQITFKHFPLIGDYIDVPISFKDVGVGAFGLLLSIVIFQQFPSDQVPQGIVAVVATLILTIYLCWRPGSNPEKTNLDLILVNAFRPRKKYFRQFHFKDIGRND
ncbi:hypothetical protein [Weissella viridescens]|uniref:hypothetical protein n=1 Tax=Weissella viridescens TaxID=1629 RepID=UPI003AF225E2